MATPAATPQPAGSPRRPTAAAATNPTGGRATGAQGGVGCVERRQADRRRGADPRLTRGELTAWIGLLLVCSTEPGQGVGRRIHSAVQDIVSVWPGIRRFRLAVVATNAELATPSWTALGYSFTGKPSPTGTDNLESRCRIYAKPLGDSDHRIPTRPCDIAGQPSDARLPGSPKCTGRADSGSI